MSSVVNTFRANQSSGVRSSRLAGRRYQIGQGRLVAARAVVRPSVDEQRLDELAMRLLGASEGGYMGPVLVTLPGLPLSSDDRSGADGLVMTSPTKVFAQRVR
jgi:hypothetical protein